MPQKIQLFAGRQIRTYWDDNEEKYYFCIVDVVEVLTDSKDPADYFKKLRKRDPELDAFVRGTSCPPPTNEIRKDLTDQWKEYGVEEGIGYATLTDIIYQSWAGLTAKEYKHLKGLHKENLRDNMTNEELVMNMLAELTTTNITKEEHPITMDEHAQAASRGGSVARVAREAFEQQTGKKVVSDLSMDRFLESQQPHLDFSEDNALDGGEDQA